MGELRRFDSGFFITELDKPDENTIKWDGLISAQLECDETNTDSKEFNDMVSTGTTMSINFKVKGCHRKTFKKWLMSYGIQRNMTEFICDFLQNHAPGISYSVVKWLWVFDPNFLDFLKNIKVTNTINYSRYIE